MNSNEENLEKLLEIERQERISIFTHMLSLMTNGEWDEVKKRNPGLHAHVKQAVNRDK